MLAAFAAPLAFLTFWSQGHAPYLHFIAPLLLLAAVWAFEPWLASLSGGAARRVGGAVLIAGAAWVVLRGHTSRATTPTLDMAARWLQARCAGTGCLVNALPPAIDLQSWADLQAGAPLPLKAKRDEAFVLGRYPPSFIEGARWQNRVRAAREGGWSGPILYVRPQLRSMQPFNADFNPEHRLEGTPDLAHAPVAATFRDGADIVEIFDLSGAPG